MKIFFIGPYQDISMEGFISRKIIENILNVDSVDLTTHPINLTDKIDRNIEIQRSNNNYIDCDILIQHAPIDMLVGNCMIRKSIIIPICNQPNIKNLDMLKYKKFDQILVNNKYSLDFFKKSFGNKTILYKFSALSNNTKKTFNSKFLSNSTKFYFIGNYRANKYLVKKIILSFMIAFRCNPETSLMFFLDDQPKELEEINDHINHYSKQINLNINHKPIVITPIDISEETLNVIHNTGDIS